MCASKCCMPSTSHTTWAVGASNWPTPRRLTRKSNRFRVCHHEGVNSREKSALASVFRNSEAFFSAALAKHLGHPPPRGPDTICAFVCQVRDVGMRGEGCGVLRGECECGVVWARLPRLRALWAPPHHVSSPASHDGTRSLLIQIDGIELERTGVPRDGAGAAGRAVSSTTHDARARCAVWAAR